jgi:hypothetical protein
MIETFKPLSKTKQQEALAALAQRLANKPKRINNESLKAGSAMYYYCRMCGAQHHERAESDCSPVPKLCAPCQKLANAGWDEKEKRFITYKVETCSRCDGSGQQSERRSSFGRSYTKTWGCDKCDCTGRIVTKVD